MDPILEVMVGSLRLIEGSADDELDSLPGIDMGNLNSGFAEFRGTATPEGKLGGMEGCCC